MAIRNPAAYPWSTPLQRRVIGPTGLDDDGCDDSRWEEESRSGRLPILSVGSNASPAVLGDKLGTSSDPGQQRVYLEVCQVAGLAVGHSAHLSPPGYVAAAPFRSGRSRSYSLAWLTPEQARALDATEPSYHRRPVPADLTVCSGSAGEGAAIEGVTLYVSKHGVLAQGGAPLPLMPQPKVLAWLRERLPWLRALADDEVFAAPDVRERVRNELADGGWVAPSGL